jgi:hypothetical protein
VDKFVRIPYIKKRYNNGYYILEYYNGYYIRIGSRNRMNIIELVEVRVCVANSVPEKDLFWEWFLIGGVEMKCDE